MSKHSIDRFLEACGASGQLQVILECDGKEGVAEKKLFLPCLLAGRDPNTDLPLDDAQVSQRHALFQTLGGRLFCVDLRSRTGTHWAGGARPSGWVEPGEVVRVGPYRLRFGGDGLRGAADAGGDLNPLTSPSPDLEGLPDVHLEFVQGPTKPMTWRINRALTLLGRSNDCGVALRDGSVSFFHAVLLRTPEATWVVDLLGRGGILLNGRRVRWGRLDPGDQLQAGRYVLRHRPEGGFAAPLASDFTGRAGVAPNGNGWEAPDANGTAAGPRPAGLPATRALDRHALRETLLVPLVNQFAALQNQMFSQFQQSLLVMVDRFREMHREQFSLIRDEVDRLHALTEELQTLQAELAKAKAATPPATPTPRPPATAPRQRPALTAPAVIPPAPFTPPPASAVVPAAPPLVLPESEPAQDGDNVHLWLHQRITALQRERETTMQKIFNFILGR